MVMTYWMNTVTIGTRSPPDLSYNGEPCESAPSSPFYHAFFLAINVIRSLDYSKVL